MFQLNDRPSRNVLVSCDHGMMLINRFDHNNNQVGHGQFILDHGNLCTVEAHYCINAIQGIDNPVIFDVGANIGGFSTWMSRYFPQGKIYCFEPQRLVFQILCANLAINNLHNAYTYNIALGDQDTKIKFLEPDYQIPADFGRFSLVKDTILDKSNEVIIDLLSLDSFVQQYQIEQLDLLKIDTEGMEMMILNGGRNTIEKLRPKIFIEHSDGDNSIHQEIEFFLNQFGYTYRYIENNILARIDYEQQD